MRYLIGVDEAGYGPNLGPLVISVTVWQVDDESDGFCAADASGDDLYACLAPVIVTSPKQSGPGRMAVADSKLLFSQGKGLKHLERGLLTALALIDRRPREWHSIWAALDPLSAEERSKLPWHADYCRQPLPIDADAAELAPLETALRTTLSAAGAGLIDIRSRAVFPERFNRLVDGSGSKGAVLSELTLDLLARAVRRLGDGQIKIVCDKHGGRNKYAELLNRHFDQRPIEICEEGRSRSCYRFGPCCRRVQISFQAQGEAWMPAALASMASKYLRELAMRAFNDFWCSRIPDLKPTAGYPLDAKRFKAEIAALQAKLGIADRMIWRRR